MVSKLNDCKTPVLVSLATGEIQSKAGTMLTHLLARLGDDPALPSTRACTFLLTTYGHVLLRLLKFKNYPYKLYEISAELHPREWAHACSVFLEVDSDDLDLGSSYWLQREAKSRGPEADSITYLMSEGVPHELAQIVRSILVTSLSVERKHAADKKNEASRLITLGRASRNTILRQFRAWREDASKHQQKKGTQAKLRTNIRAVALNWKPEFVTAVPAECAGQPPKLQVNEAGLAEYISTHTVALENEVARRRKPLPQPARATASFPVSNRDWVSWLQENDSVFRQSIASASQARAAVSQRLVPDQEYPTCARLQPVVPECPVAWRRQLAAFPPVFLH
jgi:hypothetical protein